MNILLIGVLALLLAAPEDVKTREAPRKKTVSAADAEAVVVHSEWGRARFSELAPGVPVRHIDMPVRPPAFAEQSG